jgi:ABC-type branched-subunit amino acid transport system permease subunit
MKTPFNKFLYVGFLALGLYQALVNKDYLQAASQLGIALAFDPFNPEESWTVRPTWQKAVLIVHLAIVAAMFGFAIGLKPKG